MQDLNNLVNNTAIYDINYNEDQYVIDYRNKYSSNDEYENIFLQRQINFMYLSKTDRELLFHELKRKLAFSKKEFEQIIEENNKLFSDTNNPLYSARVQKASEYWLKVDSYIAKLTDHSHYELIEWLFNDGKFRTDEEVLDRKDYFVYCTDEFKKRMGRVEEGRTLSFILGISAWFWGPILISPIFPDALIYPFVLAWLHPVFIPMGFIISCITVRILRRKSDKRIDEKFGNPNNKERIRSLTVKAGTIHAMYSTSKALKGNWIEK